VEDETAATLRKLGRRIAELRRERGFTQEAAAEKLGMLAANYARIEQGRQNLTIDTLLRITRMLGGDVTIADLFAPPTTTERRSRKTQV
jgi:transcriptional regulator with XRE-family HTH domain